jgi:WD40 repeat protein
MQNVDTKEIKVLRYASDYEVDGQHPYPGLYSFREEDKDYFFGRQRESDKLVNLIENNVLTIIFGKSGIGKTSLLRAGLMPILRNNYYLPIYLRINFDDNEKSPVTQAKEIVESKIKELDDNIDTLEDVTMWEFFYTVEILNGFVKPLLLFDQFEEIFTSGKNDPKKINEFITEMADLIENRVPVTVQEKLKKANITIPNANKEPKFRVVFSLREDYLPQLEMLYEYIPSIRYSRFHIAQIRGKDALDAILKPGQEIISDPDVAVEIIKKIPGAKDGEYKPYEKKVDSWERKRIEPFLLSLFCYQVNEKRLAANAKEISGELIKDVYTEDIVRGYYEENIGRFGPHIKTAIEDLLLTADGHRKMQDKGTLKTNYGVTDGDIERLVDRRIIRKEKRIGIEYIELIHDVLAPILKESRDKRQEEKRRKEELIRKEERQKRELAEKKKKYDRVVLAITGMAAICLAILLWIVYVRGIEAKNAKIEALEQSKKNKAYELAAYSVNLLDKDPTLSFRLAESAYLTERTNPAAYNALLSAYYTDDGFYRAIIKHNNVNDAGFSPDGKYIVTIDRDDKVLKWDSSGKQMGPSTNDARDLTLKKSSPGGKTVSFRGESDRIVQLRDGKGKVLREFKGHTGTINSFGFSPGGKQIITVGDDNTVRLWDAARKNSIKYLPGHTSDRSDFFAVFSHDGKRILTANSQKVLLWDVSENNTPPVSKKVETGPVWNPSAAFSRDGDIVVTGPEEEYIRLFDSAGKKIGSFKANTGIIFLAFSPDGKTIITIRGESARLWDLKGNPLKEFKGHEKQVNYAAFSPGVPYTVVTASWDNTARLWNLEGNQIGKAFKGHGDSVNTAVFSPDGEKIVTASKDGTARLWDLEGTIIQDFEGHMGEVTSAVFSPDGKYIITGSVDKTARLWDLNGIQVYEFKGFKDTVKTASFSPYGGYILIAPASGPAQWRLVDTEAILDSIARNIWPLDDETKRKYNIKD